MSAVGVKGATIQSEAERRQRKKRKDDESKDREKREGEGSVKRVKGRPFGIICCLTQSCQTPVSRHPF